MIRSRSRKPAERGYSLIEILTAITVFVVILTAALVLYDRSNRTFKYGSEAADMQQNTRIAFEKVVSDLRMAGFDFDRDGIPFSSGSNVNAWQASRPYAVGNVVTPTSSNGFTYQLTLPAAGGNSGAAEPAWNTTVGGNTNDGALTWRTLAGVNQFQQPDEQIEYPGAHAIVFRANFDYQTDRVTTVAIGALPPGTIHNGREFPLESAQFPVVTTGNDEIVAYVLHSERTGAGVNPDTLRYYTDVPDRRAYPGGRTENLVSINNIDLCMTGTCNNPPYTLQRVTMDVNGGLVRTPLATNIRSMTFTYYQNDVGIAPTLAFAENSLTQVPPQPPSAGGGPYNPLSPAASATLRNERFKISSVRVNMIGMAANPAEARYVNPTEPVGSVARNFRTYQLETLVVPRNLGKMGQHEVQTAPPGPPTVSNVCRNYCGMVRVEWLAPPPNADEGAVDQYVIIYDTVTPPQRFQQYVLAGTSGYVSGLTPGTNYYFTVAAVNGYGTRTAAQVFGPYNPVNRTAPSPPSNMTVSGNNGAGQPVAQENQITVQWDAPTTNLAGANTATCQSGSMTAVVPPMEISDYEIYRHDSNPSFTPAASNRLTITDRTFLVINQANAYFVDQTAVPCRTYYYRVRGIKKACYPQDATNTASPGVSTTDYFPPLASPGMSGTALPSNPPKAPAALFTALSPAPASSCTVNCTINLQWPKVKEDTSTPNKPMTIEDYIIRRERWINNVLDTDNSVTEPVAEWTVRDTTAGSDGFTTFGPSNVPYYTDSGIPSLSPLGVPYQYRYTVRANLTCPVATAPAPATNWESGSSPELRYPCPFTGSAMTFTMSNVINGDGTSVANAWQGDGSASSSLTTNGTGISSVQVLLRNVGSGEITDLGIDSAAPFTVPMADTEPGVVYTIYIVAKDADGCLDIRLRYYEEGTTSGCCLAAVANDPFVVEYTPGATFIDLVLRNECGNQLDLQAGVIFLTWSGTGLLPATKLDDADFPAAVGSGTVPSANLNANPGNVSISLPAAAKPNIGATTSYRVRLNFSKPISTPASPITNFCVTYRRASIDTTDQRCRIVPQPSSNPADFNTCN